MTKEEFDNTQSTADELTNKEDKLSEAGELTNKEKDDKLSEAGEDNYKFGWSNYSEITNGRFTMLGFLAIILIELVSQQSFLRWAGIL